MTLYVQINPYPQLKLQPTTSEETRVILNPQPACENVLQNAVQVSTEKQTSSVLSY
jgi:hypothetical protein